MHGLTLSTYIAESMATAEYLYILGGVQYNVKYYSVVDEFYNTRNYAMINKAFNFYWVSKL